MYQISKQEVESILATNDQVLFHNNRAIKWTNGHRTVANLSGWAPCCDCNKGIEYRIICDECLEARRV